MPKKCKTCGKDIGRDGHLCVPLSRRDKTCEWCGALVMDERHICDRKLKKVSFICNSCGRLAVAARYLCKPRKIK